jgi:phospholipid/cholesterol/gamma-HCH transport system substrate-binding protein
MRRSVREALVGFTLLGAVIGGFSLWFWLRGVSLSRNNWTLKVRFADAAGLADRSAVMFRGVQVGNVRRISPTSSAVVAELEITDPSLQLARPVVAQVQSGSLLGGDAQVALISTGPPLPASAPRPGDKACSNILMVCNGSSLEGATSASLSNVTELMQSLLIEAEKQNLVPQIASTTKSFDATSLEATRFLKDAQKTAAQLDVLIRQLNVVAGKAEPMLASLTTASADAAAASRHVRNLTAALDNPRTLAELKTTVSNAERLTARIDAVGGDVSKLTSDPRFMDGVRSLAIGLGQLFDELYPAQTGLAKDKAAKDKVNKDSTVKPGGGTTGGGRQGAAAGTPLPAEPPRRLDP